MNIKNKHKKMKFKRGQVTIFVIIAVLIIALVVLAFLVYPKIKTSFSFDDKNPSAYLEECLKGKAQTALNEIALRGGSLNPELNYSYNGEKISYICYTDQYYLPCVVQQPMLREHMQEEIKNAINSDAKECFDNLQKKFEGKGYSVQVKGKELRIEILPKKIEIFFNGSLIVTKESSTTFNNPGFDLKSNMYDLVSIANSILSWETKYGDSETTVYMTYYPNIKVEKKLQSEGTTVYILTERNTKEKLQFASRSVAWPPGFG